MDSNNEKMEDDTPDLNQGEPDQILVGWQDKIKNMEESKWLQWWPSFVQKEKVFNSIENTTELTVGIEIDKFNLFDTEKCDFIPFRYNHSDVKMFCTDKKTYEKIGNYICTQIFSMWPIKTPLLILLLSAKPSMNVYNNLISKLQEIKSTPLAKLTSSVIKKQEELTSKIEKEQNKLSCYIQDGSKMSTCISISRVLNLYMTIRFIYENGIVSNLKSEQQAHKEKVDQAMQLHVKILKSSIDRFHSSLIKNEEFKDIINKINEDRKNYTGITLEEVTNNSDHYTKLAEIYCELEFKYINEFIHSYEFMLMKFIGINNKDVQQILLSEIRLIDGNNLNNRTKEYVREEELSLMKYKNKLYRMDSGSRYFEIASIRNTMGTFKNCFSLFGVIQKLQYILYTITKLKTVKEMLSSEKTESNKMET